MSPVPESLARRRLGRGLTLVELMVAVALMAILLAVAVPSFRQLAATMRIEGAGHNLSTDLQLARNEAIQRRAVVTLATRADGAGYTIAVAGTTLKSVTFTGGVAFSGGVAVSFDPLRGLGNAAAFTGSCTGTAAQLRVSSDAMGRVQMCSPDGALKGYPSC